MTGTRKTVRASPVAVSSSGPAQGSQKTHLNFRYQTQSKNCSVRKAAPSMKTSDSPLLKDTATSFWPGQFLAPLVHTRHRVWHGGHNHQLWREHTRFKSQICCLAAEGPRASPLTFLYLSSSSICNKERKATVYFLRKRDEEQKALSKVPGLQQGLNGQQSPWLPFVESGACQSAGEGPGIHQPLVAEVVGKSEESTALRSALLAVFSKTNREGPLCLPKLCLVNN